MRSHGIGAAALLLGLAIAAGCGLNPAPSRASAGQARAGHSSPAANAEQSFVAGYRAYQAREFAAAVKELSVAALRYAALRDYALFFLGRSQSRTSDYQGALETFNRLSDEYPESVFFEPARLRIAQLELKTGNPVEAETVASALMAGTARASIAAGARMVAGQAQAATGHPLSAYHEFQEVRIRYPLGADDSAARAAAYALLRRHPQIADTRSEEYLEADAALLLSEGQHHAAFRRAEAALALAPARPVRARLVWLKAQALRAFSRGGSRAALIEYLALAPDGPEAPHALNQLAHLYWNQNDTGTARRYFIRLARRFPQSRLAPEAVYSIGRTYEDDGKPGRARSEYERVLARYPRSRAAHDARFRAPWMLYMTGRYGAAAKAFARGAERARAARDRDRFRYWEACALKKRGAAANARALFAALAASIDTNYYPALAELKVAAAPRDFPAAAAPDPSPDPPPAAGAGAQFHLSRALVLARLDLPDLEVLELQRLESEAATQADLRGFVLARFQAAGAWYAAIAAAERMAKRGEINRYVAERVRYPRAFLELIDAAARRQAIDPYLLLALTRQESLFNPRALSRTGARGLMQLEPATARKAAARGGMRDSALGDLYEPALNVELGASWLKHLLVIFHGDRFKAVAAYNAGQDAVMRWEKKFPGPDDELVENLGYRETRNYVRQVVGGMREYKLLYGAAHLTPIASAGAAWESGRR